MDETLRRALRAFAERADFFALDRALASDTPWLDYELVELGDDETVPWRGSLVESVSRFIESRVRADLERGASVVRLVDPRACADALIADAVRLLEAGERTTEYMRETLRSVGVASTRL